MPMSVIQVICTDSLAALDARSSSFDDAAFALGLLLSQALEDEGVRYVSLLYLQSNEIQHFFDFACSPSYSNYARGSAEYWW